MALTIIFFIVALMCVVLGGLLKKTGTGQKLPNKSNQHIQVHTSTEGKYDVFISKKSEDSIWAKEVCDFLESQGVRCFLSERELPANQNTNYYQTIDKALDSSTNLIVICSRAEYLSSKWVQHEWQSFCNEKLSSNIKGNIITIKGDNVKREDIPYTLRNLELINWSEYSHKLMAYVV